MAGFIDSIKEKYATGGIMWRLLIVNLGVFIVLRCLGVVFTLTGISFEPALIWLGVPADISRCLIMPWTFITYMFVHYDFFHILFNMLAFYWFAQLFLKVFTPKQMFALYIYGGLGGAILYVACYNVFPYFEAVLHGAYLIGASASILAIIVATAVKEPDYKIGVIFFGAIPLKWLAIGTIVIDFISIVESNAGGHIAHLGGAIIGFLFAYYYKKGSDITSPFNNMMDRLVTFFRRFTSSKPRRFTMNEPQNAPHSAPFRTPLNSTSTSSNGQTPSPEDDEREMNIILEKIKRSGYASLTESERKKLFGITTRRYDNQH